MTGETRNAGHSARVRRADRMRFGSPSNGRRITKSTSSPCFHLLGHALDKELLRRLFLRPRGADRCEFQRSHADARREIGDLAARLFGQWPTARRIVVATRGPRTVGGEKSWRAKAVTHLAHIGGPGENVVARIEHVGAEMVTGEQFGAGRGHDLHKAESAGEKTIGLGANKPMTRGFASTG